MQIELSPKEILTACALRFDGYQYEKDSGFDGGPAIQTFRDSRKWDLSDSEKLTCFFLLQRSLCKWDLVQEPRDGRWWQAFRAMFLEVIDFEVPVKYRHPSYFEQWGERYAGRRKECIEVVRAEIEGLGDNE
jgi:hypothetical protein